MMGLSDKQKEQGSAEHWARINEATFATGMHFLFLVCRVFGRWPFRLFLYPVLCWYLLVHQRARAASREYLRRIEATNSGVKLGTVFGHFASFAENMLDKMLLWSGLFDKDSVVLRGHQPLDELAAKRQGCLVICSHIGNLDLCRVLSRDRPGLKMTVLVHTKHARTFNRLMGELDPDSQLNLMQVTEMSPAMVMLLTEKVRQGEFVAIAGDRIPVSPNPRVVMAKFLGEDAPFPIGPYVLASLLQCPVFLMFTMRVGKTSEVHLEPFRDSVTLPRNNRDAVLAGLAADFAARLEHHCLRAPMQWFNFYDFWHLSATDNNLNSTNK